MITACCAQQLLERRATKTRSGRGRYRGQPKVLRDCQRRLGLLARLEQLRTAALETVELDVRHIFSREGGRGGGYNG